MANSVIADIATALGVDLQYVDGNGREHIVSDETLKCIVGALGFQIDERYQQHTLDSIIASRAEQLIEPVFANLEYAPITVPLNGIKSSNGVTWRLEGAGRSWTGESANSDTDASSVFVTLPTLAPGYYRLHIDTPDRKGDALIIQAPEKAYCPSDLDFGTGWGVSIQLYELTDGNDWGVGDFTVLRELIDGVSRLGADAVGINPLHALFYTDHEKVSPYSPSSRLFRNPLYLDVSRVAGASACERLPRLWRSEYFKCLLNVSRERKWINYRKVADRKHAALEQCFEGLQAIPNMLAEFDAWVAKQDKEAWQFAKFEALSEIWGPDWRLWPTKYKNSRVDLPPELENRARYHLYLQWQIERQLHGVQQLAKRRGMSVGLYQDLALGSDPAGAEVWAHNDAYMDGIHLGAPADALNPSGQDWGFQPMNPYQLRENEYRPFIHLLRRNMDYAGALRLDHILGLWRQFWIPEGKSATDGTYIHLPWKEMLAIVMLESQRQSCLIVGEDLGTVPIGLREQLMRSGILSYRLLYFESDSDGLPLSSEVYPGEALTAVSTHDLPQFGAWWNNQDMELRDKLHLWPNDESRAREMEERSRFRNALSAKFSQASSSATSDYGLTEAAYQHLAKTPCRLLMVQPDDLLGIEEPINVPGTTGAMYPNWSRHMMPPVRDLLADPRFLRVVNVIHEVGRRAPSEHSDSPWVATYRFQLGTDFTLTALSKKLAYFADLGISHLYLSPILRSRSRSSHGYDLVDPTSIDPDLGGLRAFLKLCTESHSTGLSIMVDCVPNHMAADPDNRLWRSLLLWGRDSQYRDNFDVDWSAPQTCGKLILPILGKGINEVINSNELLLLLVGDYPHWRYFDNEIPFSVSGMGALLRIWKSRTDDQSLLKKMEELLKLWRSSQTCSGRKRRIKGWKLLAAWYDFMRAPKLVAVLTEFLNACSSDKSTIAYLAEQQSYWLCDWHRADWELNYRRFFDINGLVGVAQQRPEVFAQSHAFLMMLLSRKLIEGIRIDHVDGLQEPTDYLCRLNHIRDTTGLQASRIYVEKILASGESLPCDWDINGTTGYDYLNICTRLLLDRDGVKDMHSLWQIAAPDQSNFTQVLHDSKMLILDQNCGGDIDRVKRLFPKNRLNANFASVLKSYIAALPVYRTYMVSNRSPNSRDEKYIHDAMEKTIADEDHSAYDVLREVLLNPSEGFMQEVRERVQQISTTVAAKGLEDTALYRYMGVLAENDVGGDPVAPAISIDGFHQWISLRLTKPHELGGMLTTSTHDTKRGEDSRARLIALTEFADQWEQVLSLIERDFAKNGYGMTHFSDRYLVYQTLLASWPPEYFQYSLSSDFLHDFKERIEGYVVKALREAKLRSSWRNPNSTYERSVLRFTNAFMDSDIFTERFIPFVGKVARIGALNSLVMLGLKLTLPGLPDLYQGCELWDLSLVDPDNRRPVDFDMRYAILRKIRAVNWKQRAREWFHDASLHWYDGYIKFGAMVRLLDLRKQEDSPLVNGDYTPILAVGSQSDSVFAFQRCANERRVIVIAGLRWARRLMQENEIRLASADWSDTTCELPSGSWRDILTGSHFSSGQVPMSHLLSELPVTVLENPD